MSQDKPAAAPEPQAPATPESSSEPRYLAEPGMVDRDGEMTGAITVNMILCMPPVLVWCMAIGPMLVGNVWVVAGVGVAAGIAMPVLLLRTSQRIWARVSHLADRI